MMRYKTVNILCLLFISLLLGSCGANGCKYPDEIKAGGFWDTTLTTIVRPINRNVIETENSIGEYTLKKGTTEAMANSNLWVPLQNTDGTYATIEAGKRMKLSVSGAISLTGYKQDMSINFQDWISAGTSPFSFAPINLVSKKGADIKIVEIKKKYTFKQDGTYTTDTIYTAENGDILFNLDEDTADISEDCKVEEEEPKVSINYAFLSPKKIVFENGVFYPYYINSVSSGENTGTEIVLVDPIETVEISSNIEASVEKVENKYYYAYKFIYQPTGDELHIILRKIYEKLAGGDSTLLSKDAFIKYFSDNNYASKEDAKRKFEEATSTSETTISFSRFLTIHPDYKREYVYSRLIIPNFVVDKEKLKTVFSEISNGDSTISKSKFSQYWSKRDFFSEADAEAIFDEYAPSGSMDEAVFIDAMEKNNYGYPDFEEKIMASQFPTATISCVECNDGEALGKSFKYGKKLDFSPVTIYFKSYNDVFSGKFPTTYKDSSAGNDYTKYFLKPSYALDRKGKEVSNPDSHKYKSRFTSSWHKTGASQSDNIHYSTNCRVFPKKIYFNLLNVLKHTEWKNRSTPETTTTYVKLDNGSEVTLLEYCSKYCLDLCATYFSKPETNAAGKVMMETAYGETKEFSFDDSNTYAKNNNPDIKDEYWGCFARYSPVDAKDGVLPKEPVQTNCTCSNYNHSIEEVDKKATNNTKIRNGIYSACREKGWNGLYAKYDNDDSGSSLNYNLNKTIGVGCDNVSKFTIVKHLFGYGCTSATCEDVYISYLLCSPYDAAEGRCTSPEEQCNGTNCKDMGWFYANGEAALDDKCPSACEETEGYTVYGRSDKTQDAYSSFDVVSVIDYRHSKEKNPDPRKSSKSEDADNSIYYRVNNGEDIAISGYSTLTKGLIPIGGADNTGVECYDGIADLGVSDVVIEETFNKRDKDCRVSGSFSTYTSSGTPTHHLYYTPQSKGILPIKWSSFNVRPGDILPITIKTAGSGSLPALIRNTECDTENCYEPLTNGNGLVVVLESDDVKIVNENLYKHPEYWMCNYGLTGSYGKYRAYNYGRRLYDDIPGNIIRLDFFRSKHNERSITSNSAGLEWKCKDDEYIWFSGYDFKNFKQVSSSLFPQPHIYSVASLNLFLPDFDSDEDVSSLADTSGGGKLDKIECGEDGIPNSIQFTNGNIIYKKENEITVDSEGRKYRYKHSNGSFLSIDIDSSDIQKKIWPSIMPTKLVFEQDGHEQTVTYTKNNLIRKNKEGIKYVYQYFLSDSDVKREIAVNSPSILQALCRDDGQEGVSFVETSSIVKRLSADNCGVSCIPNEDKTEIYTPYGPFSGLNKDTSTGTLPAIYSTYGMCNNKLYRPLTGGDSIRGKNVGSCFIYDTEEANGFSTYRTTIKGVERKPLDIFWRIEFNTPVLEKEGDSAGSNNFISDSRCSTSATPDIMYIDIADTLEWKANNDPSKGTAPTIAIHKNNNNISRNKQTFYSITYSPWGWSDEKISKYDSRIVEGGITCGGLANCDDSEVPEIEIVNNGERVKLMDMTKYPSNGNATIKTSVSDMYLFSYLDKEYSINADSIKDKGKLCNLDRALSWLSYLVSDGETTNTDGMEIVSIGRAPYAITCSGRTEETEDLSGVYQYPYATYLDTDGGNSKEKLREINKMIFAGADKNSEKKMALVLATNNSSYLTDKHFAHCTTSWQTPGWMLLNNSGDMSSFNKDFNAISGSFIPKPNKTLTWDDVNKAYTIENVWAKYGGIITNSVYNNKCDTHDARPDVEGGDVYVNCKHEGTVSVNYPKFKAVYDKQIIAVKTLGSDPVNATDTNCSIKIDSSESSNNSVVSILANEPFGNSMPSAITKDVKSSKKILSTEDVERQNENVVQRTMTVNGDIYHQDNFFKKTEMYRNIIGAGIVKPEWHIANKNGSSGQISIFQKGETISINPSEDYFYAMGNLNHDSRAYCVDYSNGSVIGLLTGLNALMLALEGPLAYIPAYADLWIDSMEETIKKLKKKSSTEGKMTPISLTGNHITGDGKEEPSKRQCGTGMAFRVIPIPNFLCKQGFHMTCSNKRINKKLDSDAEQMKEACRVETEVDWSSDNIVVGRCYVQEFDTERFDSAKSERSLKYNDAMYKMNGLSMVVDEDDNTWNETENIYQEQCGLCLTENSTSFFNGVHYYTADIPAIPSDIKTKEQCQNYKDSKGNKHVWATNYAKRTPFENYSSSEKQSAFNALNEVFRASLTSCVEETDNDFQINFTNEEYYEHFLAVFNLAMVKNEPSCIASLESLFYKQMQLACRSELCLNVMQNDLTETAMQGCRAISNVIENKDGKYFSRYLFSKNRLYSVCKDNKTDYEGESGDNDYHSLTRVGVSKSLQDYGYAELTDTISDASAEENSEGIVRINVHIPTTLKGKKLDPNKNKLHVGFTFAGKPNDDSLLLYKDYKLKEPIDMQRGYDIQLGNGTSNKNGKYLYFYIQPNASDGNPDPAFEPNSHFNLQVPNVHGKQYTKEEILEDPAVHHFVDYDQNGDGTASIVAEDTGKIWLAILDVDEKDENGVSISDDRDGRAIIFDNELETKVNGDNVLGTNTGFYKVYAKIQGDDNNFIGQFIDNGSGSKIGKGVGAVTSFFVNPIKHILFGVEDGSSVKKIEGWFSKQLHFNKSSDDSSSAEGDEEEKDTYLKKEDSASLQKKGLLYQIIKIVLSFSLLHTIFYILMVGNAILFGIQVALGQQKLDSQHLMKPLLRFSFIYMLLRPSSLEFYFNVIVVGIMNISDGLIAMVASNFTDDVYYKNSASAAGVAFGPVNNILQFWFRLERAEQALAILCSSWFGWVSVLLLLLSLVHFLIGLFEAIAVYVLSLLMLLLQLALGPIQFFFLIFEKTSGKFWDWLKGIAGIIAQQTALFSALAIFATVYYHILKGSLNFPYCWEPVLKIPILNIPLLYAWKVAGTLPAHMAEMMGEYGPTGQGAIPSVGFSPLTGICIFLITATMSKFIEKSAQFGASLFGTDNLASKLIAAAQAGKQKLNSSASSGISSLLSKQLGSPKRVFDNVSNRVKGIFS